MIAVVTGGASSGKSAYAEDLVVKLAAATDCQLVYLATMQTYGSEGVRRVARHRALRAGKGFSTIEAPRALSRVRVAEAMAFDTATPHDASAFASDPAIPPCASNNATRPCAILLEDLGNLVANELFADDGSVQPSDHVLAAVTSGVDALIPQCAHLVVVTNEIGADGVEYAPETHAYQEILGACSCSLAAQADLVVEVVNTLPNILKGTEEGGAR